VWPSYFNKYLHFYALFPSEVFPELIHLSQNIIFIRNFKYHLLLKMVNKE
jgi:hypothetical protein